LAVSMEEVAVSTEEVGAMAAVGGTAVGVVVVGAGAARAWALLPVR
jgi:hypothetical protein